MNIPLISITTLHPLIHIAALVPFFVAIIMWLVFYSKYNRGRLSKIGESLKRLADEGENFKDCNKENTSFMDEMVVRMAPPYFLDAWLRMQMQLEKNYQGNFIPDGEYFYPFDTMITVPGCRNRLDALWKAFWVLCVIAIFLPFVLAYLIQPSFASFALAEGIMSFILLCIGNLIFTLLDQKNYHHTKTQYYRFISTFNRILPVAKPEVALLLEATQRNQETYETSTGKIIEKFDSIVSDMLLPTLEDSISTIMHSNLIPALHHMGKTLDTNMSKTLELQEKGMEDMTTAFANRLADTVEVKLTKLAETIGSVQDNMKLLNESMNNQVETLTQTISSSIKMQQELMSETMAIQDQSLERLHDHITQVMDSQTQSLESQKEHIANAMILQNQALELQKEHVTEALALQDKRMKESFDLQEQTMNNITTSFSNTLNHTVETQMSNLAMSINDVGGQMEEFTFKLSNHVNEFIEGTKKSMEMQDERLHHMLTAQDQRMDQIMDLQGENMANIATSFANSLEETLQRSMANLNEEFEQLKIQMNSLNGSLSTNVGQLSAMLESQHQIMEDSAKLLMSSGEMQERTLLEAKEIQTRAMENTHILNSHIQNMGEILHKLTEQNTAFTKEAFQFTKETNEAQMRMSESVKLSQDKLESAVNETMSQYAKMNNMISQMMDNITDRMNEAMTNAGREIAIGIKEVTADNAEAIANLTEQAHNLRTDYEAYFTRMEDSTTRMLEDMDYQIRTITVRISEDIGTMMEENIKANADILERYKDNTTDLLQSFDEQARSIGLYAKEINLDITELSNNLQSSVAEFSEKLQEGVHMTLGEFDNGLAELTKRIANTVESISDAVEALPEALRKE
jgi:hypothetical protein